MISFRTTILATFFLSSSHSFTISHGNHGRLSARSQQPFEVGHYFGREDTRLFALEVEKERKDVTTTTKGVATLHFKGEKVFQSDPLPLESIDVLQSFFEQEQNQIRAILLGGSSGRNTVMALPLEEGIKSKEAWSRQCKVVGGSFPSFDNGDVVYKVNSDGMNMGGLQIKNEMLIGATMVEQRSGGESTTIQSPEYQFVFISDKRFAEGPRLLVWVFNKLMGGGGKKDGEEETEQAITSLTRFYAKITSEQQVVFTIESSLDIAVNFPSFMLKILPVSKEKAEEEGSASVMKTLIKDTEPVISSLSQFYLKTVS